MLRAALWYLKNALRGATRIPSRIGSGFGLGLIILGTLAALKLEHESPEGRRTNHDRQQQ